jgi:AraC-like DNA-binding protein
MVANFWDIIFLAMTAGTSLICAALIIRGSLIEQRWPSHAIALIAFFAIMFAESVDGLNGLAPINIMNPRMVGFTLPLVPALGACMWFYVSGLTSIEDRFERRDLWHLVPIFGLVACTIPYLLLSNDQQQVFASQDIDMQSLSQVAAVLFIMFGWIGWVAILVLYGTASLRRLLIHRKQMRALFSNVDNVSLAWLHVLIVIVFTFTGLAIIGALLPATNNIASLTEAFTAPFYFCLVFAVGSFGVLQKSVIPTWSELETGDPEKQKYQRSALRDTDMTRIARKLDATMQDRQLWQNPNLSLHDFSRETGISQNNISQTLNDHLGRNFYDYVNSWRIDAACNLLRKTDQSVLNISLDAGFNAKSTFNAAFRKVMDQTPRQFRTNAQLQISSLEQGQIKGADGPDRSKPV